MELRRSREISKVYVVKYLETRRREMDARKERLRCQFVYGKIISRAFRLPFAVERQTRERNKLKRKKTL